MIFTTDLPALLRRLRQPAVRDLAWALLAPPLLTQTPWTQRHPLQASRWAKQPDELANWLLMQDADSRSLQSWLQQNPVRRLGLYYEKLWQFALHAAPDVEVLTANLPIRQQGHTLGELDLLLRDNEGIHHLELAVKFYLTRPAGSGLDRADWLGPGSHDRLDIKLDHLAHHQLPLSSSPAALEQLHTLGIGSPKAALWLSGYLFYPWQQRCSGPQGHNFQHLKGRWLHHKQWSAFADEQPGSWQLLPRSAWLAPARITEDQLWSSAQLNNWLHELPADANAQLLVRLAPDESGDWLEQERIFLVNNHWPQTDE